MPVFNNMLAGASGGAGTGYEIERSLRFNSGDTSYLNRTPSAAGNRTTWTWSGWVKQGSLATGRQALFAAYGAGNDTDFLDIGFDGNSIFATANSANTTSTSKFRDPSAWFHYFVRYDGSNVKWYINGVEAHSWSRTGNLAINGAWAHQIGRSPGAGGRHFDGYLAEVNFVDAQALAPTDFGETDDNGVWQPKKYTFGTNPNNGTTWSSNVTQGAFSNVANMFDGSLSTVSYATTQPGTVTWSSITVANKVRVYGRGNGSSWALTIDGSSVNLPFTAGNSWVEVTTPGSLTAITNSANDGAVLAIEVDGYVLLNGAGDNSFHLDFADNSSNAALGTDTSGNSNTWTVNNLTASIPKESANWLGMATGTPFNSSHLLSYAFDGNTNTQAAPGQGNTMSFTPSPAITGISKIRIKGRRDANAHTHTNFSLNGIAIGGSWSTGTTATVEFTALNGSAITQLTNLSWAAESNSNEWFGVYTIEIYYDGSYKTLVSSTSAGPSNIDSLVDTPTNGTQTDSGAGGEVVSNYATLNPLDSPVSNYGSLTNGNLNLNGVST